MNTLSEHDKAKQKKEEILFRFKSQAETLEQLFNENPDKGKGQALFEFVNDVNLFESAWIADNLTLREQHQELKGMNSICYFDQEVDANPYYFDELTLENMRKVGIDLPEAVLSGELTPGYDPSVFLSCL